MVLMMLRTLSEGVGYGALIAAAWLNIFYIVVLAWAIYYLVSSMAAELPWASCDNWWNSAQCRPYHALCTEANATATINLIDACAARQNFTSPVREFWEYALVFCYHARQDDTKCDRLACV